MTESSAIYEEDLACIHWAVLVDVNEAPERLATDSGLPARDIIVFRDAGGGYRRSQERHLQRAWRTAEIQESLEALGFAVSSSQRYGDVMLGLRRAAFVAQVPAAVDLR